MFPSANVSQRKCSLAPPGPCLRVRRLPARWVSRYAVCGVRVCGGATQTSPVLEDAVCDEEQPILLPLSSTHGPAGSDLYGRAQGPSEHDCGGRGQPVPEDEQESESQKRACELGLRIGKMGVRVRTPNRGLPQLARQDRTPNLEWLGEVDRLLLFA